MARVADRRPRRLWLGLLYLASLAAVGVRLWRGWGYYRLPELSRPLHPDYALLTSGGTAGHLYGIAGSALIVLLLLYVLRKRWRPLSRLGSLRLWLDVHIWMGVTGPLLIVLHSAFKVGGLIAFSFWSMVAVALSGVLGRYLYLQIPRDEDGEELDAQGLHERQAALLAEAGIGPAVMAATAAGAGGGPLTWLRDDLTWLLRRRRRRRAELLAAGVTDLARALAALRRWEVLQRRRRTLDLARRLLHHWHVFHRPFAFIMIFFMIVHIVVTLLFTTTHGAAP